MRKKKPAHWITVHLRHGGSLRLKDKRWHDMTWPQRLLKVGVALSVIGFFALLALRDAQVDFPALLYPLCLAVGIGCVIAIQCTL